MPRLAQLACAASLAATFAVGCRKPEGGATAATAATAAPAGSATPEPAGDAKRAVAPQGTVAGVEVRPTQAVFLWRKGADDLQLVFADTEGLCAKLQAGAMPKGATVLWATLKHNVKANRDAPFAAGDYPIRGEGGVAPQDTKRASVAQLDDACKPRKQARATAGAVRLATSELGTSGVAEGSLDLEFDDGSKLAGAFRAEYCAPPEDEPRACR